MTQHIHSLRARGVMSSHNESTFGVEVRTVRRSAGKVWTVPEEIPPLLIGLFYQISFMICSWYYFLFILYKKSALSGVF